MKIENNQTGDSFIIHLNIIMLKYPLITYSEMPQIEVHFRAEDRIYEARFDREVNGIVSIRCEGYALLLSQVLERLESTPKFAQVNPTFSAEFDIYERSLTEKVLRLFNDSKLYEASFARRNTSGSRR